MSDSRRYSPSIRVSLLVVGLLVLVGLIAEVITTREGSRITPDSVVYIDTARAFTGVGVPGYPTGLVTPPSYFGPLFPIAIGLVADIIRADPLVAGRWLNIMLFGVTLTVVGGMTYCYTNQPMVTGFIVFFMSSQPEMLRKFGSVLSEPLFMVCFLAAIWLLIEDRMVWAGVFTAIAILDRNVGFILIAGGVIGVLLISAKPWPVRLRKAAIFGGISTIAILLWLVRNLLTAGTLINRGLAVHLIGGAQLQSGLIAISRWFMLDADTRIAQIIALTIISGAIVAMICAVYRQPRADQFIRAPLQPLPWIGLISLIYVLGLLFSISLVDAAIPFDDRLLLPLFPISAIGLACLLTAFGRRYTIAIGKYRTLLAVGRVLFALFAMAYGVIGLGTVGQGGATGQNYADAPWLQSPLLTSLKNLPAGMLIVTNVPEIPFLYAPRPTAHLPLRYDPHTLLPNPQYADEMATLNTELIAHTAIIVYWRESAAFFPTEDDLRAQLSVSLVFDTPHGATYASK